MPSEQRGTATHCRLYLISPEHIEHPTIFADDLRAALDGGDVAAFQLRLKDVSDDAIVRAARRSSAKIVGCSMCSGEMR